MRLDLFLKNTHLIKKRSQVKKGIEFGRIKVNGNEAKPAYKIKIGDIVEIDYETAIIKFQVLEIAEKPVKKAEQEKFVKLLLKKRKELFE